MKTHYKPLSRFFPKGHIREGEPTCFVEKLVKSIGYFTYDYLYELGKKLGYEYDGDIYNQIQKAEPKYHTIRSGNSVKVGDKIQFYVWSGKPYRSKWILIAEPIEVKKVWDFEIINGITKIMGVNKFTVNLSKSVLETIAKNDGLTYEDFKSWFGNFEKPFIGQIICWDENINY